MSEDIITITNPVDFMDKSFMEYILKNIGLNLINQQKRINS